MSYNVILTDNFKRESKRLVKKFPSLKQELQALSDSLEDNPLTGTPLAKIAIKYAWPSLPKEREKAAVQKLSPMFI